MIEVNIIDFNLIAAIPDVILDQMNQIASQCLRTGQSKDERKRPHIPTTRHLPSIFVQKAPVSMEMPLPSSACSIWIGD